MSKKPQSITRKLLNIMIMLPSTTRKPQSITMLAIMKKPLTMHTQLKDTIPKLSIMAKRPQRHTKKSMALNKPGFFKHSNDTGV